MKPIIYMVQTMVILLFLLTLSIACPRPATYSRSLLNRSASIDTFMATGNTGSSASVESDGGLTIGKRWYSVDELEYFNRKQKLHRTRHASWPVVCGHQWIRYCFKDEHSADNLLDFVANAAVLWSTVDQYSNTAIQPDIACEGNYRCVCGTQPNGQQTMADALVITDGRGDNDNKDTWETDTWCTLGYDYTNNAPERHHLVAGIVNAQTYPLSVEARNFIILTMTHELGKPAFPRCRKHVESLG